MAEKSKRLAANERRACLEALLKAVSEPASLNKPLLIRKPLRAGWLALPGGAFLTRVVPMPVDDPQSRLSKFAEQHPVEIAFALLFLVALSVVLAI
jgi:hypothetical protein